MRIERCRGGSWGPPFPVHEGLVERFLRTHRDAAEEWDPVIAHTLAAAAGYAYSDAGTVAMMLARLGFAENACVRVSQAVDAMFIHSTATLIQSRCGRVVVLAYRGTEPASLASWLGDADAGPEPGTFQIGGVRDGVRVHGGFQLNVRATWWGVMEELRRALAGRSLAAGEETVESPMEALYLTGHSLGGAMAVLLALAGACESGQGIADGRHTASCRLIGNRLRAVYTFGQPMAVCGPVPAGMAPATERIRRFVMARDIVPALPMASWGPFCHVGREYRFHGGRWVPSEEPVAPLTSLREIPRAMLAFFSADARRRKHGYSLAEHGPHYYLEALRPEGRVTEFGD